MCSTRARRSDTFWRFVAENLFSLVAKTKPVAAKLRALGKARTVFDHVDEAAHAFVAGLVADKVQQGRKARRVWIVAATPRSQEQLHNELLNWHPEVIFLPEAEIALAENALPDPEIAADRLQALEQVTVSKNALVILTAASLNDSAPSPEGMRRLTLELSRGETVALETLVSKVAAAGYERVPQVALRGQYAVRGGIVDLFSWQHTIPVRVEFFGDEIDSLRFFDLDVQTSVQPVESASILLGDPKWAKAKSQAQRSVFDYASKLLSVHAARESAVGFSFPPDNKWQNEFERSFVYKETPDQITAIADTKTDMEGEQPMDRLICGDVGFGKTEVAIRAAFKAVMGGKQVALLVPTTVLAQQHYQNFRERMSDYPITVDCLSRFRTQAEQRKVVEGLKDGSVDIVIGTHRLISKDVRFKNLGLVVIDEEQRFGVLHKEKFKELFKLVDVLTLSATPIPRTLYLSLMGAKDMSILETPPQNRIPTETVICGYDERIIRDAIVREMARQGQVYFLHNRVGTIEMMATKLKKLIPKARILVGHGQMDEHELEEVMRQFVEGEADVLLSTTIIESGLDIPNANTIIIDRADRFGLADLYQLRGRVGRAQHKAYAYLMIPRDLMQGEARKRINAIKQYSSLGAGFKIAMRDLEIRGAGNILGTQQSGHIVAVGFDLYCQLLKQAVAKLKGEKLPPRVELPVSLDFTATNEAEWFKEPDATAPAFLPTSYISEAQTRIQAYRALAEIVTQEQIDRLRGVWRDRFGRLPEAVENLLTLAAARLVATARKITRIEVRERKLMLTRGGDYVLIDGKFPRLSASAPAERLREMLALLRKF